MKKDDFENWDPDYDIPDDPRLEEEKDMFSPYDQMEADIVSKETMRDHITNLRNQAIQLREKQESYWEKQDNYNLEELPIFIHRHKEDILGIMKDAIWLVKAKKSDWEDNFKLYYDTLLGFIERSRYVISSYDKAIRKLRKGI